jgi:hypothetical protein
MGFKPATIADSDADGCIDILIAGGNDGGSMVTFTMTKEAARDLADMILTHLDVAMRNALEKFRHEGSAKGKVVFATGHALQGEPSLLINLAREAIELLQLATDPGYNDPKVGRRIDRFLAGEL